MLSFPLGFFELFKLLFQAQAMDIVVFNKPWSPTV